MLTPFPRVVDKNNAGPIVVLLCGKFCDGNFVCDKPRLVVGSAEVCRLFSLTDHSALVSQLQRLALFLNCFPAHRLCFVASQRPNCITRHRFSTSPVPSASHTMLYAAFRGSAAPGVHASKQHLPHGLRVHWIHARFSILCGREGWVVQKNKIGCKPSYGDLRCGGSEHPASTAAISNEAEACVQCCAGAGP